jgi:hypothetical protein
MQVKRSCGKCKIDDDDSTIFAEEVCGQHACQLVQELPRTRMPNKKCMLGFVVQATKVQY